MSTHAALPAVEDILRNKAWAGIPIEISYEIGFFEWLGIGFEKKRIIFVCSKRDCYGMKASLTPKNRDRDFS